MADLLVKLGIDTAEFSNGISRAEQDFGKLRSQLDQLDATERIDGIDATGRQEDHCGAVSPAILEDIERADQIGLHDVVR